MHDIKWIRHNAAAFDHAMEKRGLSPLSQTIIDIDENHRQSLNDLQNLQKERNAVAADIGKMKSQGVDATPLMERSTQIKALLPQAEDRVHALATSLDDYLISLPNIPAADVPEGLDETGNQCVRTWGSPRSFDIIPKAHYDLGEDLGMMDFEKASILSGSRFVILRDDLARLERALGQFMLTFLAKNFGYREVSVPVLVKDKALFGTGQLPKFRDDQFQTTSGHYLIATSEIYLTNLVCDEILDPDQLPLRYTAQSLCFRQEAGAAGRDTRGMMRQHQFTKVEMVSITHPQDSINEHERMVSAAEGILQALGLPYRVMLLCAGDMGFSATKTYDLEVWLPSANAYREISSCSNCGDFQARRMKARYRDGVQGNQFVHTLNGSGLAVGRTLIAVMENYQQSDGSISIPQVLQPLMDHQTIIKRSQS